MSKNRLVGMAHLPVLTLAVIMVAAPAAIAATISYYRFEDSPGFLKDSSGNGYDLTQPNPASGFQATLPASGRGSAFPTTIPQTGAANAKAYDVAGVTASPIQRTFVSPPVAGDFTIEAFVHPDTFNFTDAIFGNSDVNGTAGFAFQARHDTALGNPADALFLTVSDTSGGGHFFYSPSSTFVLSTGIDYYVAAAFDDTLNATTLYLKDLTDNGALQSTTVILGGTWNMKGYVKYAIGNYSADTADGGAAFDGLIDEARLSSGLLPSDQLLITAPQVIPEPTAVMLFLAGGGFLWWKRRS